MKHPDNWQQMTKAERKKWKRQWKREQREATAKKGKLTKYAIGLIGVVLLIGLGWWAYTNLLQPLPGQLVPSLGNAHIPSLDAQHEPYNSNPPTSGPHLDQLAVWGIHDQSIPDELQVHNLEDGGVMVQYNCEPNSTTGENITVELTPPAGDGSGDLQMLDSTGIAIAQAGTGETQPVESTASAQPAPEASPECQLLITELTNIVNQYADHVILAPYPKLDTRIALTAWTRIDKFNDFDHDRVQRFIKKYRGIDHHPQ